MTCRSLGSRSNLLPEMPPLGSVSTGHPREAISALMDETQSGTDSKYCAFLSSKSLCFWIELSRYTLFTEPETHKFLPRTVTCVVL